jgi:hypothetical protein
VPQREDERGRDFGDIVVGFLRLVKNVVAMALADSKAEIDGELLLENRVVPRCWCGNGRGGIDNGLGRILRRGVNDRNSGDGRLADRLRLRRERNPGKERQEYSRKTRSQSDAQDFHGWFVPGVGTNGSLKASTVMVKASLSRFLDSHYEIKNNYEAN